MTDKNPNYNPKEIEPKWQKKWQADGLYHADIDPQRQKYYALTMLPYPSGDLHIGHWYAMTPSDARARFMRMRGFNVLFPMGFDAFGLPAENAAIKHGIHPKVWTYKNIENMRQQLRTMGAMFDWRREAVSSDPQYYRWTQWFFIQLFKHGSAYRKHSRVDWCPNCNTTLAREQVWGEDRHCERCGTAVTKKELEQWFFKILDYAEELLDFSQMDWPDRVRLLQENWINRSEGAAVYFPAETGEIIEVFTTRPDTLWGATFMVLAPEHPLVAKITSDECKVSVAGYIEQTLRQSDLQREAVDKEKTGVFTGGYAINPVNNQRIPVWIADYILMTYGTGAIMAVPAHDQRDFDFAMKYGLPILPVIDRPDRLTRSRVKDGSVDDGFTREIEAAAMPYAVSEDGSLHFTIPIERVDEYVRIVQEHIRPGGWVEVVGTAWLFIFEDNTLSWNSLESEQDILERCRWLYSSLKLNGSQKLNSSLQDARTLMELLWREPFYREVLYHDEYGTMINSGEFSGAPGSAAVNTVTAWLESQGIGKKTVNYRLRDWLISRQRYWGAPIPMVYCETCGWQPEKEENLPVLLPDDVEWKPTGESPLKLHPTWKLAECPVCGAPGVRETDTMDTFMCSSWYHLRYLSPDYQQDPYDPAEYDYWMPVDLYTGGIEHATMHLIYTRFFHKVCRDMGITQGPEPMTRLRNQGMVLGEDHEKMSKSRGNVVAPDDLVGQYGADTVRAYLMFFARWELGGPWNSSGIEGTARWLKRAWSLFLEPARAGGADADTRRVLRRKAHTTLQKITRDFETLEFNTIVSGLMELLNDMAKAKDAGAGGTPEWKEAVNFSLRMMAPVTPHIAEEMWARLGYPYSIHQQPWPEIDESAIQVDEITVVLQVNGKVRDRLVVPVNSSEQDIRLLAMQSEAVRRHIGEATPRKIIYVPEKLVNIVVD